MANGDLNQFRALAVGRPWTLAVQNQVVSYCGIGLCDPILQSSVSALENFRYDTVLFAWSLVSTVVPGEDPLPANNDGDDLAIESGQTRDAFTAGVGEVGGGMWWVKTISDTDTFKSGAPIDRPFMFIVSGLTANALDVFQRGGTGASAADPKKFSNFLQESEDGPGYGFLIQKFHINYTSILMDFGDQGQRYRVGLAAFYPSWGDPAGAQTVRNGLTCSPGMYLPFTTALCVGPRDDVKQLKVQLAVGQGGVVQNNPAQPTIAGSEAETAGTINAANDGTVYCPLRIQLVGYMVCVPAGDYCGVPALTPDEIVMMRARLGLVPVGVGAQPTGMITSSPALVGGIPTPP